MKNTSLPEHNLHTHSWPEAGQSVIESVAEIYTFYRFIGNL